ncbi:MAG: hypothetical protein HY512_03215 [Candidatus Aenigmarchaeota archaeon]|nr:hypothetical protein [Candidatus Aenigmarchaeota archaeon]
MVYLLVRKQSESDLSDAEILPHRAADVFLLRSSYFPEERGCLIWYVDPKIVVPGQALRLPEAVHWIQKPLAANYENIGSGDINGRLLVQDPARSLGPYTLDLKPWEDDRDLWKDQKVFRRGHLSRVTASSRIPIQIVTQDTAGDKIPYNGYHFIGDPQEFFEELRAEGFSFVD